MKLSGEIQIDDLRVGPRTVIHLWDEIKRLREEVKKERCFKESYLQTMNELLEIRK